MCSGSSTHPIFCEQLPEAQRSAHVSKLFGVRFIWIESFVFDTAGGLSGGYDGGLWEFYALCNGGFYMAPTGKPSYRVVCDNGHEGELSADAFGITCCLYAYSMLSFSSDPDFAELCSRNFHLLREYMLQHDEARAVLAAID